MRLHVRKPRVDVSEVGNLLVDNGGQFHLNLMVSLFNQSSCILTQSFFPLSAAFEELVLDLDGL